MCTLSAKSGSHCRAAKLVPSFVAAKRFTEYSPDQDGCVGAAPAGMAAKTVPDAINATTSSDLRMTRLNHRYRRCPG
ncbi:hypothetical protein M2275_002038 [Rhodococcus opacus]|jgi:hypothetical protein|nr:hypothetical protein [Rhodococcus opacus]